MAMANKFNLEKVEPYFIDAEKSKSDETIPVPGMTRIQFRNNHFIYACTWYGLALLILIMTIKAARKENHNGNV